MQVLPTYFNFGATEEQTRESREMRRASRLLAPRIKYTYSLEKPHYFTTDSGTISISLSSP